MNTLTNTPLVEPSRSRNYEIALDGLEFAFPKYQLEEIKELHNEGKNFNQISKLVKRNRYEVVIAILHLTRKGHAMRSIYDNLHR